MIDEEKVLDRIAEILGDLSRLYTMYGNEDNVAYACAYVDMTLVSLMRYIEELAQEEKLKVAL